MIKCNDKMESPGQLVISLTEGLVETNRMTLELEKKTTHIPTSIVYFLTMYDIIMTMQLCDGCLVHTSSHCTKLVQKT